MTTTIALFGAAGNMGTRICNALKSDPEYRLLPIESAEEGRAKLREQGLAPVDKSEALPQADVAILAVPDALIGAVAHDVVPGLKSGAMLICLDPAAPHAGRLPQRPDVSYFVTHPAHPPVFNDEQTAEARRDFFGSGIAKQALVSALMQGPESDYVRGEAIARKIFGPILRSHRVTVEQMAMLEPALSETVAATCITIMREAMDEASRRGVPAEAARDFLLGHIWIELAIVFNETPWHFSAGAQKAIDDAKKLLFQPDWKKVFDEKYLRESVERLSSDASPLTQAEAPSTGPVADSTLRRFDPSTSSSEFRQLDPRVIKLWRVRHAITSGVLLGLAMIAGLSAGLATGNWLWPLLGWHALLVLRLVLFVWYPARAYRAWGYRLDGKVLETRRGIWFKIVQLLPLSRLQHVDLHNGPIERSFGLASLLLHTAGTQHASIIIPGLDAAEAGRLRDELVAIGGDDAV
ncbi:MAG: PH domain-containing protein [Verrucomicrobia subdivision 3 bacterium]|nr:PH domain-containing protein [Limisphaerales bacterium]